MDLAFVGDAPATFALAAGLQPGIISPIRIGGAGTAVLVAPDTAKNGSFAAPPPPPVTALVAYVL